VELAFPHDEDTPAEAAESGANKAVSGLVSAQLLRPEARASTGHGPALAAPMAVPKTPVNKNCLATGRKYQVGATRKLVDVKPIPVSE